MFYGFKSFQKGLINRYGVSFQLHKEYHVDGVIKFGNQGNGFHVCERLEDTLRYFDAMEDEIDITKVRCYGKSDSYEDDYYGYYDLYAFENMIIDHIMTRDEIMEYAFQLSDMRAKRFLSLYRLTEEERERMKDYFSRESDILKTIFYYQEGVKDAFLQESQNIVLKYVKK